MSAPKHTPGPWECLPADSDGSISVIGANLGGLVGAAHCWPTEVDTGGSDRVRANALLIAAAPELLEALEKAEAIINRMDMASWLAATNPAEFSNALDLVEEIRAAIAKARGAA